MPEQATAGAPRGRAGFTPGVIEGGGRSLPASPANDTRELSMMGKIAAGTPIAAIEHETARYPVPEAMLGAGEHYMLEIEGDSMIEAGILDGDMVVIKRVDTASSGEIVVALVEGEEATLKRLRKKGGSIALEPANRNYETRIFGPDQVEVQGKLSALSAAITDPIPARGRDDKSGALSSRKWLSRCPGPRPLAGGHPLTRPHASAGRIAYRHARAPRPRRAHGRCRPAPADHRMTPAGPEQPGAH